MCEAQAAIVANLGRLARPFDPRNLPLQIYDEIEILATFALSKSTHVQAR
jgi:hypothetical protein